MTAGPCCGALNAIASCFFCSALCRYHMDDDPIPSLTCCTKQLTLLFIRRWGYKQVVGSSLPLPTVLFAHPLAAMDGWHHTSSIMTLSFATGMRMTSHDGVGRCPLKLRPAFSLTRDGIALQACREQTDGKQGDASLGMPGL